MDADVAEDDELERAFPGGAFAHVLSIVTGERVDMALEILQAVRAHRATLEGLKIAPRGDAIDYQLQLGGLRAREARSLSDQLARLPGVRHAAVEHRLVGPLRTAADA